MPRSKGRPRNRKPQDIRYSTPKDEGVYQVKRLYWALLMYEERMSKDVTAVNIKDYMLLLETYRRIVTEQKKKGNIQYRYARARMDDKGLEKGIDNLRATGASEEGSTSLGSGVPAVNPLT